MKVPGKKVLFLTLKKEFYDQIKSGEKTSEFREYKKHWIQKLMNDDGSFKTYDLILFQNGYQSNAPQLLVEFKGIKIIKERINWFKSEKYFEIELGEIIKTEFVE
jgi:hypothetical protein